MRLQVSLWCALMFLLECGCDLKLSEMPDRKKALEPLRATNAHLDTVRATLGVNFSIQRRGTPEWDRTVSNHTATATTRHKRIAEKLNKSAAVGHTSTMTMQTWIFLDDKDRLIDFIVEAQ